MAQSHNKKGRSKCGSPFVQLHIYMMKSEAWRSLTPTERAVYIVLKERYFGSNNGEISLSSREAGELTNTSKASGAKALRTLKEKGFIAITHTGAFSVKVRHASLYRLTELECDGAKATKEYAAWKPSSARPNVAQRKRSPKPKKVVSVGSSSVVALHQPNP